MDSKIPDTVDKLTGKSAQLRRASRIERQAKRAAKRAEQDMADFERLIRKIARYRPAIRKLLQNNLSLGGPRVARAPIQSEIRAGGMLLVAKGSSSRPVMRDGRQYFHFKLTTISRGRAGTFTDGSRNVSSPAKHQGYIERSDALETLPEGSAPAKILTAEDAEIERRQGKRMLFTNIDPSVDIDLSSAVRREFWKKAAQSEREPGPPRIRLVDPNNPWWATALAKQTSGGPSDEMAVPPEIFTAYAQLSSRSGKKAQVEIEVSERRYDDILFWLAEVAPTLSSDLDGPLPVSAPQSRGGRAQYRLIAELPHELSSVGRFRIIRNVASVLEEMGVPYCAVGHVPDEHNDDRNYHLHLIWWDRPVARLENGKWDFEETRWDSRHQRHVRPHIQPKVRKLNDVRWPKEFRNRYAEIVNAELIREGVTGKRFDPRKLKDMMGNQGESALAPLPGLDSNGIELAARRTTVKLGSRAAGLERRGEITQPGSAESIARSLEVIARADRRYQMRMDEAKAAVEPFRDLQAARPLAASFLWLSRQFAVIGRDRALHQEARRAALSRPTAALHYYQRKKADLEGDASARNRANRLKKLEADIAKQETHIAKIKASLDPEWILLVAKADQLGKERPKLNLLLARMTAIAEARRVQDAVTPARASTTSSDMSR